MTHVLLLLNIALCAVPEPGAPRTEDAGADVAPHSIQELAHVLNVQRPGAGVRMRLFDGTTREGELYRSDGTTLTVAAPARGDGLDLTVRQPTLTEVPLGAVEALWVSRGDRGPMGGIIGMWIGSAAGIALAVAIASTNEGISGRSARSGPALFVIPVSAALGGFLGWELGKRFTAWGKPRWTASTQR